MFDFAELEEPRPFTESEQQAIDELKFKFEKNNEINFQTDNYFLTKFLRYRDWNVEAAYKSIVLYYELKVIHCDLTNKKNPNKTLINVSKILKIIHFFSLFSA